MPKIKLAGYFGWKESMKVTAATIAAGWFAGHCFKMSAGAGLSNNADEVMKCDVAGELVAGIALESAADHASIYSGMNLPSASKVTIVHGHSKYEIDHAAEVAAGTVTDAYLAYEKAPVEAASVNDILYTNSSGELTTTSGSAVYRVGYITKVPTAANNYTLGIVQFG